MVKRSVKWELNKVQVFLANIHNIIFFLAICSQNVVIKIESAKMMFSLRISIAKV